MWKCLVNIDPMLLLRMFYFKRSVKDPRYLHFNTFPGVINSVPLKIMLRETLPQSHLGRL